MKVLIINGSPRKDGNTTIALKEMENVFAKNGGRNRNYSNWWDGYSWLYRLRILL